MPKAIRPAWHGAIVGLLAGLSGIVPTSASAQEQSPAAPLFQRAIIATLGADCARTYPDLSGKIERQRNEWLAAQAEVLAGLDAQVAALPQERQDAIAKLIAQTQASIHEQSAVLIDGKEGRKGCQELVSKFGSAGPSNYDADNFGEAAGMYQQMIFMAEVAGPACGEKFPAQAEAISAALDHWRQRDKTLIARVEAEQSRLRSRDPAQFEKLKSSSRTMAANAVAAAMQSESAEAFCKKTFDDLDSGKVRDRTPKMFQFLEAGPPKG